MFASITAYIYSIFIFRINQILKNLDKIGRNLFELRFHNLKREKYLIYAMPYAI